MSKQPPPTYRQQKLTRAGKYLADMLEKNGKPIITQFEFFRIVRHVYRESYSKKLYLRRRTPDYDDYRRFRLSLNKAGVIRPDPDYKTRVLRVLAISDLPAEEIICLVDPTCYISHLSAMQRWGLTDRNPTALMLTRPDRKTAATQLQAMTEALDEDRTNPFRLNIFGHPPRVRNRAVRIYQSRTAGAFLKIRGNNARLSTIGQTFLDMLQKPDLCGGMSHVLDVWEEHAQTYLDEISTAVDTATSGLVKSRAGYILEERLGLRHRRIEPWTAFNQRGGSRKLDPAKDYAATYSEKWMISINV